LLAPRNRGWPLSTPIPWQFASPDLPWTEVLHLAVCRMAPFPVDQSERLGIGFVFPRDDRSWRMQFLKRQEDKHGFQLASFCTFSRLARFGLHLDRPMRDDIGSAVPRQNRYSHPHRPIPQTPRDRHFKANACRGANTARATRFHHVT